MTDTDSKWDYLPFAIFAVGFVAFIGVLLWLIPLAQHQRELDSGFKGACNILHGEVHADLCVKDGRVVLTKADYKKVAK